MDTRFKLIILFIIQLVPSFCKNRKIWLPSDTTMVSPALLVKHGVSVSRAVQHPGQFVVVFPKYATLLYSKKYHFFVLGSK
jgi:hypothetical protein